MRRREFLGVLGGAVAMPQVVVRAQERVRRVGVLMNVASDDPEAKALLASFQQGLQSAGWMVGRNLRIDYRWSTGEPERYRQAAVELLALAPEVVLAAGAATLAMQRASHTIPIVFSQAIDPVGAGIVASLAKPGGNATGFMQFEYSLAGKWLQLLREIAPAVTRVGMLREPATPAGIGQWAALQVAAEPSGIELSTLGTRDNNQIERSIEAFAREPNGGLVVAVGGESSVHRRAIIESAAKHGLPVVYPHRFMAADGGLISYGIDLVEQYRHAAAYVDRILKGEKPADLPVQKPTKYALTINLNTARALGFTIPPTLLARADEVIE